MTTTTATPAADVAVGALCFRSGNRFRVTSNRTSYGITRITTTDGGTIVLGPATTVDVVTEGDA